MKIFLITWVQTVFLWIN